MEFIFNCFEFLQKNTESLESQKTDQKRTKNFILLRYLISTGARGLTCRNLDQPHNLKVLTGEL